MLLGDRISILTQDVQARNSVTSDDHNSPTGPARVAHVDLSGPEIIARIRKAFPDRADFLLRGRVRLVKYALLAV